MSKRTKAIARDLHDRGLRKQLANRVAEQLAASKADARQEAHVAAAALRRLADEIEAAGETAASEARRAEAKNGDGADGAGGTPAPVAPPARLQTRPRVRRN